MKHSPFVPMKVPILWTRTLSLLIGVILTLQSSSFFIHHDQHSNDDSFITHRVSSPVRYAAALNLTVQQVAHRKEEFRQSLEALHRPMEDLHTLDSSSAGAEKHRLICQHRLRYGQHPFACPDCWSYLPVCVCDQDCRILKNKEKNKYQHSAHSSSSRMSRLEVIDWFHHSEWGLISNTGGLVRLGLGDNSCKIFMKGLPDHDNRIKNDYLDKHPQEKLVVVLWPANDGKSERKRRSKYAPGSISPREFGPNLLLQMVVKL